MSSDQRSHPESSPRGPASPGASAGPDDATAPSMLRSGEGLRDGARDLEETVAELEAVRERLLAVTARAHAAESALEGARVRIHELSDAAHHHQEASRKLEQRLKRLQRTRSWKMTAGLRRADSKLRGARKSVTRTARLGRQQLAELVDRGVALVPRNEATHLVLRLFGIEATSIDADGSSALAEVQASSEVAAALSPDARRAHADLTSLWTALQSGIRPA